MQRDVVCRTRSSDESMMLHSVQCTLAVLIVSASGTHTLYQLSVGEPDTSERSEAAVFSLLLQRRQDTPPFLTHQQKRVGGRPLWRSAQTGRLLLRNSSVVRR